VVAGDNWSNRPLTVRTKRPKLYVHDCFVRTHGVGVAIDLRMEIRVTGAEKARWAAAAKKEGVSLSDWARHTLNEASARYQDGVNLDRLEALKPKKTKAAGEVAPADGNQEQAFRDLVKAVKKAALSPIEKCSCKRVGRWQGCEICKPGSTKGG
jgi:hypothetical protein